MYPMNNKSTDIASKKATDDGNNIRGVKQFQL
jgi:hypothetical protein